MESNSLSLKHSGVRVSICISYQIFHQQNNTIQYKATQYNVAQLTKYEKIGSTEEAI